MKECFACKVKKEISFFYSHVGMKDGYLNKCKDCVRAAVARRAIVKKDYIKEYEQMRATLPHRVEARRKYIKTENGKLRKQAASDAWAKRNPEKTRAKNKVSNAIRDKRLFRPHNCELCNKICKPQGHHADYSKPLSVLWVCVTCHNKIHGKCRNS